MTIPCPETSTICAERLRESWRRLPPKRQIEFLANLNELEIETFDLYWEFFRHSHQNAPVLAQGGGPWSTWLVLAGRGAGKTRAGAEWVRKIARDNGKRGVALVSPIALVGETEHDAREVMVEGIGGLLAVHQRGERPVWIPSRRRLEWRNGTVAQVFSAEDPESLRGPQFAAAWCDELAKWRHAEAAFDMLQFGLRLGERPRQVITTTPRPIALIKRLLSDPATAVTRAGTAANARHLAPAFLDAVVARYAGTRLGRQEIDGEIVEERSDALWTRSRIEDCRLKAPPQLARIVFAVDPPASARKGADACGLVAAGKAADGVVYVIADDTATGLSPMGWARRAIALWRRLHADALVAEVNQGGDMVRAVIREADPTVPVIAVRARRGKWLRAEPVALLYEQGRVKHAGIFPALEDEMCDFGLDGLSSGRSPDRLDALVWAVSALTFEAREGPRVRAL
jgi:phage terminase large subunit-like protein